MSLRIIFMGTPNFAVPILHSIKESNHNILSVYTQTPKKKNRGQKMGLTPIHEFSKKNNIKVTTINKAAINKLISLLLKLFKKLFIVKSNLNLTRNQIFI